MITFQCYSCQQVLRVSDDKGGRKAKCPKCGTSLTIPVASGSPEAAPRPAPQRPTTPVPHPPQAAMPAIPAVPVAEFVTQPASQRSRRATPPPQPPLRAELADEEDDEFEEDAPARPKKPISLKAKWRWVRVGLLIVFISMCVLAGAMALQLVAYLLWTVVVIGERIGSGTVDTMLVMWRIAEILAACTTLAAMVGYVFCTIGPNKYGSMGLAIATASVAFVELLFSCIFKIPFLFPDRRGGFGFGLLEFNFGTWLLLLLTNLFLAATVILFPLYLRAVSQGRKNHYHAGSCISLVWLAGAYAAERLLTWILFYVSSKSEPSKAWTWIILIMLWIGAIVFAVFLIRYIIILWRTREIVE